jgi:two-component system, NarL family, sensor histidine kinase UhpB
MEATDGDRTTARRDLILVVVGTVVFALLCAWLELSETVLAWTRPHERFQLDEIPGILLFLASALAWYASRRVREARAELTRRRAIEMQLRDVLEQNRELARAGVRIQEEERRDLARELHDELGQYLNAVKIDAVCLRDGEAGSIPDVHAGATAIVGMTDHLQVVVRDMVRRLRPPGLDELGLTAALENCVDGWRRRLPAVEFAVAMGDDLGSLDEATNITLYRLIQEGLTNVAKHAQATRVEIVMHRDIATPSGVPELVLTVQDNGVGTRATATDAGLGIVGMRERVEALAGRFAFTPVRSDGFGFGFTAWLPMRPASAA